MTERTAVVTGGASGIGRSIALRLSREGARVAVWDLDLAGAEAVVGEFAACGREGLAVEADVSRGDRVRAAAERTRAALGPIHILVNNAGIAGYAPLAQMTDEQWDRMLAVHLTGAFHCTKAVAADMVATGWGRVVNITSLGALTGGPGLAHYAAAKAGLIGFSRALAQELGPSGVTVNAIAPSVVDTPMLRGSGVPEEILRRSVQSQPIRRMGTAEDIAAACAYIVSEDAGFLTGQVISPNGGRWM